MSLLMLSVQSGLSGLSTQRLREKLSKFDDKTHIAVYYGEGDEFRVFETDVSYIFVQIEADNSPGIVEVLGYSLSFLV
jgi:hypothetical protein